MTITQKQVVNIYIVYEINLWLYIVGQDFALRNFLFGAIKLTKNADFGKYKYSEYSIGFHANRSFSLSNGGGFGKNVIMVGLDMSSLVHIGNNILILGKVPKNDLDYTTLTAEK